MSAILNTLTTAELSDPRAVDLSRPLTIAVAGNPNAGKTSLFNSLTGLRQKVANYPGVTVESKTGLWTLKDELPPAHLIDLPGLYSLDATSIDEQIARDVLVGRSQLVKPDAIVVVVDATNLVRNLYLATQLIDIGLPLVIALTMFDLAERGQLKIDVDNLSSALGVPVVPFVAKQGRGTRKLAQAILDAIAQHDFAVNTGRESVDQANPERRANTIRRYSLIEQIVNDTVQAQDDEGRSVSERIDAVVTHRFAGPLILLLVMILVFQAIFSWANLPMNLISQVFGALGNVVRANLPEGILTSLLADGIIAGVGGVLVFLPQIFLLFLFISVLEDSGYMARAAFLMDRVMRTFGLHGKAFMPLLSSFACAVPGIMATRTIENPKDRLATIMIAPFMSCSARLPVYTLMIAAVFSGQKVFGFLSIGVVIILGMYALGIAVAVIVSWILKHTILKGPATPFMMELPPYRLPSVANVGHAIFQRVGLFVKRAGTVILAISILLWAMAAFPRATNAPLHLGEGKGERELLAAQTPTPALPQGERAIQLQNSYAGRVGHFIEPAIAPLGFDWRIGIGLIASFAARETIISTLSIVYNVGADSGAKSTSLIDAIRSAKRPDGSPVWTPLVALSLMIFFVLACQCMSTVAIVRRETNSWRWPLFMVGYMLVLAYVASLITYQGGRLLGFS
jgi:ferrous iron transport protein B